MCNHTKPHVKRTLSENNSIMTNNFAVVVVVVVFIIINSQKAKPRLRLA